jgi:hypothetical protein
MKQAITVEWLDNYEKAIERARSEKKPLLLDFFKQG